MPPKKVVEDVEAEAVEAVVEASKDGTQVETPKAVEASSVAPAEEVVEVEVAVEASTPSPAPGPRKVNFQYDRDTTLEAIVVREHEGNKLDLHCSGAEVQKFTTSATIPVGQRTFTKVRQGSRHEPGTWFED